MSDRAHRLNSLGDTRATAVTLLLPIPLGFWAAVWLQERPTVSILVGMAVILVAVALVTIPSRRPRPGVAQ